MVTEEETTESLFGVLAAVVAALEGFLRSGSSGEGRRVKGS